MSSIVWLASYPKSGSTWIRILLSNYLRDADEPADINALGGRLGHAAARVLFDEWVGVEASALEQPVIDRLRPEVYRSLAREAPETLYLKVHDAWTLNDRDRALFPADATAGVVYVVRNPLDTAASCAHHWGVGVERAVERMCDPSHSISNSLMRLDDQLRQFLGSWSDHVQSWLDDSGLPCHVVRYEDLRQDAERAFGAVVRFCGLPDDAARVRKAVEFSDLTELRRQERENGFRERSPSTHGGFFRRGEVGSWHDELPLTLARRLAEVHRETMSRLGYLDETSETEVSSGSVLAGRA